MNPEDRRRIQRNLRMTQPVRMTMGQLAIVREILLQHRDEYRAALAPFGFITTWEAQDRLNGVIETVIAARCNLKRRQHPDYNPTGDSECESYATDAERGAWAEAHPLPDDPAPSPTAPVSTGAKP